MLSEILAAEERNDFERLEGLLCGAVKYLHGNRSKPDQTVFVTLMYLAKVKPNVFNSEIVIEVKPKYIFKRLVWTLKVNLK